MSALPPIADIRQCRWDVRKVPIADFAPVCPGVVDIHDCMTLISRSVTEMLTITCGLSNRAICMKSRPGFCAKTIQFFLGGRAVDPIKRFCKTFFELQCKCDRAPSYERARQRQLTRLCLDLLKLLAHAHLDVSVEAAYGSKCYKH
jgi:hypothetical protein